MKLWAKILIGLFLGIALGLSIGPKAEILKPVGTLFLNLISMLIVPLIFSSMTVGITSINDPKKLGRVGIKTIVLYLLTTAIAILFGLFFATVFKPGQGALLRTTTESIHIGDVPSLKETLFSIIPSNPIASMAQGNVLQVIVFSVLLGLAITAAKDKGKPLLHFLESVSETMFSLTTLVMKFSPIGVFAIMASVSGSFGVAILLQLAKLLITVYLASIVHFIVVFGFILVFMARLNPLNFLRGMSDAMMFAFSTSSSSATLPVTLHCVQKNLGVSKHIAGFILPLGSTVNMNGTALFQGIAALFIAQVFGIDLGIQNIFIIVVTATISAIGTAGIPGGGFVIMSIVLASVGLPLEGIALLFGIDRLRDMVGTVVNIVGDAVVAVYVAKTEGELDEDQYNHPQVISLEESDV